MYLAHWGLARPPFAHGAAQPLFYEGESQSEAAARLRFVVRQSRPLAVLAGARGVGKSLLLRRFVDDGWREGRPVVHINAGGLSARELIWELAAQFALSPRPADDAAASFRRIAAFVQNLALQHGAAAVLLDDADHAGPDVQSQLLRLLNLGWPAAQLTIVLAAAPEGLLRLSRELLELADLRIDLEPWSEAETVGYVQHALFEAGCERPAFDDQALTVIHTLSEGVPRRVNRLADRSLLAAAADGLSAVDAATVEAAHDALNWPTAAQAAEG